MKKILIRIVNRVKFNWTMFRLHNSTPGRVLKREARNSDVFGFGSDLLKLIDAKLALVENSFKTWKVYVDQEYDLRNIKLIRSLIKRYLECDFFDYEWPAVDFKKDFLGGAKYIPKVYVNPRTIDRFIAEMDPAGSKNEKLVQWYKVHVHEVYAYKLNRLIWNILRDHWTDFNL